MAWDEKLSDSEHKECIYCSSQFCDLMKSLKVGKRHLFGPSVARKSERPPLEMILETKASVGNGCFPRFHMNVVTQYSIV